MIITSIEVIRHNPGIAAEVVAGERVELTYGQSLRVYVSLDYRGPGETVTLYGAIGVRGVGFDEKVKGEVDFPLPGSPYEFSPCSGSVDIPITSDISPGADYDLYVKLLEYPGAGMPEVNDVIDIVGIPPTYELIQETVYPWAYIFQGDVETCIFEFKLTPEQIPTYPWLGERIVDSFVSELEKEGSRLLELRVYEDTTPMFWTNYRVEVTATASPIAWMPIIILVLAVLFLVALAFVIREVRKTWFEPRGLDEETKKTFSRETLIAMILDLSPETPLETLEAMEDQELRDLLNKELPPPPPPFPWELALIAGLGVLGVGAAVALAARRE